MTVVNCGIGSLLTRLMLAGERQFVRAVVKQAHFGSSEMEPGTHEFIGR